MKMKAVYLNGIYVGDAQSSGDPEADLLSTRQFLKDKGIYKETTLVQAMFRQAVSFAQTSARIYEVDLSKAPRKVQSVVPFVVNCSFSIELYLKTLGELHTKPLGRGHELVALYDRLPPSAKTIIQETFEQFKAEDKASSSIVLRDILRSLNNAFIEWRYCYESSRVTAAPLQHII